MDRSAEALLKDRSAEALLKDRSALADGKRVCLTCLSWYLQQVAVPRAGAPERPDDCQVCASPSNTQKRAECAPLVHLALVPFDMHL